MSKITFRKYTAIYYIKDEKTEKLTSVGHQEIFYFSNDNLSLAGRAYTHAQGRQKDAVSIEFVEYK